MPENQNDTNVMNEVVSKLGEAHNVLVALSSDPTVDEMAAAIGLTLSLDRAGKRATAIYSGMTPNALEFLKPKETFDSSADVLQDFVIALSKDKADHLRYKLDGDFVKIFITPYKTRIDEEDLEFSYGDYNIDLVLALDVANGTDLDAALREHGRIMHDATIVNVTTGNPGKFGDIQWSDKAASSVSEMGAKLLMAIGKNTIEGEEATAFLTGIVAATSRFSKANTTAETMDIASKLMMAGADQQLISQNITMDINNEMFGLGSLDQNVVAAADNTAFKINHEEPEVAAIEAEVADAETGATSAKPEMSGEMMGTNSQPAGADNKMPNQMAGTDELKGALLDDLKAAAEEVAKVGEEIAKEEVAKIADGTGGVASSQMSTDNNAVSPQMPEVVGAADEVKPEKVLTPSPDLKPVTENSNKYGQMLEEALAGESSSNGGAAMPSNPAATVAPTVASEPEINGVPEMNFMPMPEDEILPPPPTPPLTQPAMQDQVYNGAANNPGAFKIPGAENQ